MKRYFKRLMFFCSLFILSIQSQITHANSSLLQSFDAEFNVKIFYFSVGTAYQSLRCEADGNCLLKNQAKPPKWAKRFINESVKEEIQLQQTSSQLLWKSYKKHLTRTYEDRPTRQIYTDLVNQAGTIKHLQSDRTWTYQPQTYDLISLAYALQHAVLNKLNLKKFVYQDEKGQQGLKLKQSYEYDELELPIEYEIETERFEFRNGKINAQIWLAPSKNYFPVMLVLEDKEKDRTITLELSKLKYK